MDKIKIIFIREYLIRVKSKMFLLSTLLTPLGIVLIIGVSILASTWREDETFEIFLEDQSQVIAEHLQGQRGGITFITELPAGQKAEEWLMETKRRGWLKTDSSTWMNSPPRAEIQSAGNIPLSMKQTMEDTLTRVIRNLRLSESGISDQDLKRIGEEVKLKTLKLTDQGTERSSTGLAAVLGYVMGILIYIFMFTYGMIVMRGVMEEKTNRIVEIIISSVQPFQLMIGKLVSIAAVGLTQFGIWILLIMGLSLAATPFLRGHEQELKQLQEVQSSGMLMQESLSGKGDAGGFSEELIAGLVQFDVSLIFYFIFYFLGGYLVYGSLFAAVGSAVDQESDTQQLIWPITIPLIIPMLMMGNILQQPDGTLAVFCSLFPLFSPVCMLVRMASVSVPWYEIMASMVLLILTFLGMIWMAGRIYRVGIFMYGKKPSIKEITRWIFS